MRTRVRRLVSVALVLAALGCKTPAAVDPSEATPRACPADAKVCADGTTVTRGGPECEFPECPGPATAPTNGLTPDPAPQGPTGDTNPEPMGTFSDPEPPPG